MAMSILSVPTFPAVPNAPGVPPLLRNPLAAAATLAAPLIGSFLDSFSQVWGVQDSNGNMVLSADSFLGIDYTNSRRIANYPIEAGSFASYNKVNDPFRATVRMAKGGTLADRESFLAQLQTLADSLALYTLITPEETYKNVNMERFDYRRDARNGAGIIVASCHFVQIRIAAQIQYQDLSTVPPAAITNQTTSLGVPNATETMTPTAQAIVNLGQVKAALPSSQQAAPLSSDILLGLLNS